MGVTKQDIDNYVGRMNIANAMSEQFRAAVDACGPGAIAYGVWVIRDKLQILPDELVYCCRRHEFTGWQPEPPNRDERLSEETHPGFESNGKRFFPFRFTHSFQALEEYRPVQPEKLAERRAKRQLRIVERTIEDLQRTMQASLFPEMYHSELQAAESQRESLRAELSAE